MESTYYSLFSSPFGIFSIVWQETQTRQQVIHILLPPEKSPIESRIRAAFKDVGFRIHPTIKKLGEQIQSFLEGNDVNFDLNMIALDNCSEFQRKVLLTESKIPRGWVSTYGIIARKLVIPKGARAVGNALARNPFPIIIPCHRAIQSNGELGGYQGGLNMKRALLEFEGLTFSGSGKIIGNRIYNYGQNFIE